MTEGPVSRERALAHGSRVQLLRELGTAGQPMDARELAVAVDLHLSTVRAHLLLLERAGLVSRHREERTTPGRPRVLYAAARPGVGDPTHPYRLLAGVLAGCVADHTADPAGAAEAAGRRWGRQLADSHADATAITRPSRTVLVEVMDELGFDPAPGSDADALELRRCPFLEVAQTNPEVACALHLGVMRGAIAANRPDVEITSLLPWADGVHCVAHLTPT